MEFWCKSFTKQKGVRVSHSTDFAKQPHGRGEET